MEVTRIWWSGRGRTADLPFLQIKDHCAGPAGEVSLPAQRPTMHADQRRCTCMYETRNETVETFAADSPGALAGTAKLRRAMQVVTGCERAVGEWSAG